MVQFELQSKPKSGISWLSIEHRGKGNLNLNLGFPSMLVEHKYIHWSTMCRTFEGAMTKVYIRQFSGERYAAEQAYESKFGD